ncbi:unnamed protein product, partial [Laminaria digitata]
MAERERREATEGGRVFARRILVAKKLSRHQRDDDCYYRRGEMPKTWYIVACAWGGVTSYSLQPSRSASALANRLIWHVVGLLCMGGVKYFSCQAIRVYEGVQVYN